MTSDRHAAIASIVSAGITARGTDIRNEKDREAIYDLIITVNKALEDAQYYKSDKDSD